VKPSARADAIGAVFLALFLPILLTWPLVTSFTTALPAAPDQEAATHLWGLWAALHEGSPLVVNTDLLAFPDGASVVLIDPGNLPWFALGSLWGPAAGYNTVVYAGVVLMGFAGAMLARRLGGSAALGVVLAAACPTMLANTAAGMTEGAGVGWVGIQLALLLCFVQGGRWWLGALAALAHAAAWYCGPYNGVWAAMLDLGVAAMLLLRARANGWRPLAKAVGVGAAAAALVVPLAWGLLVERAAAMPGGAARAGMPAVTDKPDIFRGGVLTGADLLDPWLPGPLTGGEADVSHTAYLGVVLLGAAFLSVAQDRRRWPWLAGALAFAALSLGPWLYWGGHAVRVADGVVPGPAALLIFVLPALGRLTRWYRAGAIATLLLVPLAAALPRRGVTRALTAALVVADVLLLAPLQWPLHQTAMPDTQPYLALAEEGALLELPPATTGQPPPGLWRDRTVLAQVAHEHPVGGGMMLISPSSAARGAQARLEALQRGEPLPAKSLDRIRRAGFRWLALYPEYRPVPADARANLEACFGSTVAESPEVWLFDLAAAPDAGCSPKTANDAPSPVH
jgi:hypothetical protein